MNSTLLLRHSSPVVLIYSSFDNLAMVPKSVLTLRLGALGTGQRHQICDALAALANC